MQFWPQVITEHNRENLGGHLSKEERGLELSGLLWTEKLISRSTYKDVEQRLPSVPHLLRLIPDASAPVAPPQPLPPPPSHPEQPIGPLHKSWSATSLHTPPTAPSALPFHPLMQVPTRYPGQAQDLSSATWRTEPPTPFSAPLVLCAQGPCFLRMRAEYSLCPKA